MDPLFRSPSRLGDAESTGSRLEADYAILSPATRTYRSTSATDALQENVAFATRWIILLGRRIQGLATEDPATAVIKRVLCPERLRHVPRQFSWIDHRLVGDRTFRLKSWSVLRARSDRPPTTKPNRPNHLFTLTPKASTLAIRERRGYVYGGSGTVSVRDKAGEVPRDRFLLRSVWVSRMFRTWRCAESLRVACPKRSGRRRGRGCLQEPCCSAVCKWRGPKQVRSRRGG